jgi:hypothetical protein
MTARITADRARLAELEAEFAENPRKPYVAQNLATYRARVAEHDARVGATAAAPARVPSTPATPAPARRVPLTPATPPARSVPSTPATTREDGVRAVGKLFGATADEIEQACREGLDAGAFLNLIKGTTAVDRIVARILAAGEPSAPSASTSRAADANSVDAIAARIAAA